MKAISFWADEQIYGLPLLLVGEFYPTLSATRFETGDPRVYGIAHIRGGSAVVLDMRTISFRFGDRHAIAGAPESLEGCDFIYIQPQENLCDEACHQSLRSFDEATVLIVDRLDKILDLDTREMHPPPAHLHASFYDGVFKTNEKNLILINFANMIESILRDARELCQ